MIALPALALAPGTRRALLCVGAALLAYAALKIHISTRAEYEAKVIIDEAIHEVRRDQAAVERDQEKRRQELKKRCHVNFHTDDERRACLDAALVHDGEYGPFFFFGRGVDRSETSRFLSETGREPERFSPGDPEPE